MLTLIWAMLNVPMPPPVAAAELAALPAPKPRGGGQERWQALRR